MVRHQARQSCRPQEPRLANRCHQWRRYLVLWLWQSVPGQPGLVPGRDDLRRQKPGLGTQPPVPAMHPDAVATATLNRSRREDCQPRSLRHRGWASHPINRRCRQRHPARARPRHTFPQSWQLPLETQCHGHHVGGPHRRAHARRPARHHSMHRAPNVD